MDRFDRWTNSIYRYMEYMGLRVQVPWVKGGLVLGAVVQPRSPLYISHLFTCIYHSLSGGVLDL